MLKPLLKSLSKGLENPVMESLSSMCDVLGSIPRNTHTGRTLPSVCPGSMMRSVPAHLSAPCRILGVPVISQLAVSGLANYTPFYCTALGPIFKPVTSGCFPTVCHVDD